MYFFPPTHTFKHNPMDHMHIMQTYLELTEKDAAACPLHDGEECLVGHLAHEAEGVELLVFASAGLLLLQVGQDLGLNLRLVRLTLKQLYDQVREAGR